MCGIHVSISRNGLQTPSQELEDLLCKRGPDYTGKCHLEIGEPKPSHFISVTSTVLALRGGSVARQPFVDQGTGSILCWNGEVWKLGQSALEGGNDGQVLFDRLVAAAAIDLHGEPSAVVEVLNSISGPFAFVFLDKLHSQIFFGRDCLGRRSLLHKSSLGYIEFASTSDFAEAQWEEVEADGIYMITYIDPLKTTGTDSLSSQAVSSPFPVRRFPWNDGAGVSLGVFNRGVATKPPALTLDTGSVLALWDHLRDSLKLRILNIPEPPAATTGNTTRVAILFSGGLDCTVLARIAHDILPHDQDIDLINVAFENPRVVAAANKPIKVSKKRQGRAIGSNLGTKNYITPNEELEAKTLKATEVGPFELCPDRETGRKAFLELGEVCPHRTWRFIAVDIPYTETRAHKDQVIGLIHPHNTEMDLSIAFALYFASRGTGTAISNADRTPSAYTTPARVLLSGLGADELFGGYGRHHVAFERTGFSGLLDELELDVNRLGKRNLGRDDRVISHWGKEARFPYLDESLVKWAVRCPIEEKCGFRIEKSEPETPYLESDKKVLRLLAYKLGMQSVAQEKKRAIQFGARTAKMEVGSTKGTTLIS
ncbi:asparagine synthase-domain-containing protein [Calycina marina]|uniref:Asparagine synthase-domain-containing protein n=1 Tax=Calycina marina TaxID=1763456 RepID=A0A9P7ZA91_9HELO|nr:asparagine synthase-domain-containing protein [Calycina marina]